MVSSINNLVWVRGTLDVQTENERWTAKGVYTTEEAAMFACTSDADFIIQVELNKPFPIFAIDAIRMYYPFIETWETSVLFKMRQQQRPAPKKCAPPQLHLVKCDD